MLRELGPGCFMSSSLFIIILSDSAASGGHSGNDNSFGVAMLPQLKETRLSFEFVSEFSGEIAVIFTGGATSISGLNGTIGCRTLQELQGVDQ